MLYHFVKSESVKFVGLLMSRLVDCLLVTDYRLQAGF